MPAIAKCKDEIIGSKTKNKDQRDIISVATFLLLEGLSASGPIDLK